VIVRGKVNAKDRDGNITSEVKILADDAREVTHEQAAAYQETGRKPPVIKAAKRKGSILKAAVAAAKAERNDPTIVAGKPSRVYIRLVKSDDHQLLQNLKMTIDECAGTSEVVLVLGPDTGKQVVKLPARMDCADGNVEKLRTLVGASNVVLQ